MHGVNNDCRVVKCVIEVTAYASYGQLRDIPQVKVEYVDDDCQLFRKSLRQCVLQLTLVVVHSCKFVGISRSFVSSPFIVAFLLISSSITTNSSGLRALPRLNPMLIPNSSDTPAPMTTLQVVLSYVPSIILTYASGTPIQRSTAIAICISITNAVILSLLEIRFKYICARRFYGVARRALPLKCDAIDACRQLHLFTQEQLHSRWRTKLRVTDLCR